MQKLYKFAQDSTGYLQTVFILLLLTPLMKFMFKNILYVSWVNDTKICNTEHAIKQISVLRYVYHFYKFNFEYIINSRFGFVSNFLHRWDVVPDKKLDFKIFLGSFLSFLRCHKHTAPHQLLAERKKILQRKRYSFKKKLQTI